MIAFSIIAFILAAVGIVLALGITPESVTNDIMKLVSPKQTLRDKALIAKGKKKSRRLTKEILHIRDALDATGKGKQFTIACSASIVFLVLGCVLAMLIDNYFLMPVFAAAFDMLPFFFARSTISAYDKHIKEELETALSVITTAYLRTENFQQAVEENVRYLHPPVQEVFQHFLMRIKHIDPDMDAALTDLKAAIDNEVWREWCDAVMACQADRSLTSILTPIVSKLSDMRVVNAELENLVFGPRKEFITMAILVLINIPLVRFINKDWYHTLVATIPGQMVIAVCLAAVFVSFAFVVKLTQPIEYRR